MDGNRPVGDAGDADSGEMAGGLHGDHGERRSGNRFDEWASAKNSGPGSVPRRNREAAITRLLFIALVIAVLAYVFVPNGLFKAPARIQESSSHAIAACTMISIPGNYYLVGNISASAAGACIYIKSDNVSLEGNGYSITGNWTWATQGKGSYGIEIAGSKANISGLGIAKFTYGIYLNGSNWSRISDISINSTAGAGISLHNSSHNLLYGDKVVGDLGRAGGINITGGMDNNLYLDSSKYNSYYGLLLSGTVGNNITRSTMGNNPADLACFGASSLSSSNRFSASSCNINKFCNFAYCAHVNDPYLVTNIELGPAIDSCGSINVPGKYSLSSDLSLSSYMNASAASADIIPCILINASNVNIECNGHAIINAPYGMASSPSEYNVTVSGCRFQNDTYGIYLDNALGFSLSAIDAQGGRYGIYVQRSGDVSLVDSSARNNLYGMYINGTSYSTVANFTSSSNGYGVMIDNSSRIHLDGGVALQNSNADLYCTTNTYNSTHIYASGIECAQTDCNWAGGQCKKTLLPTLTVYPLTGCAAIAAPGDYGLRGNISAADSCFEITSSNVRIDCASGSTITSTTGKGSAFTISNVSNVTIDGCYMSEFQKGIVAENSGSLTLNALNVRFVMDGVDISNSSNDIISNDQVMRFSGHAYSFSNMEESAVFNNSANQGLSGVGYGFYGSFNNTITRNIANLTSSGFYLSNSLHNTVYSNYVYSQQGLGYYCNPDSAGVYSQYGRVNYGVSDVNCEWLVEIPPVFTPNICTLITTADTVSLTQDMIYSAGGTCFSVRSQDGSSADGTTINCNGNAVLATNGGTFLASYNTSDVTLENCYLIGFTNPAMFTSSGTYSSYITVFNNTFANTSNTSIYIRYAQLSKVYDNKILNTSQGLRLYEFNNSIAHNNTISNADTGIVLNSSAQAQIMNNTISDSSLGIRIDNSYFTSVFGNGMNSSFNGMECTGNGQSQSNRDLGRNFCDGVVGCGWMNLPGCS